MTNPPCEFQLSINYIFSKRYFSAVKDQEAQTIQGLYRKSVPKFTKKSLLKKVTSNVGSETEETLSETLRPLEECVRLSKLEDGYSLLSNDEIVQVLDLREC